MALTIKSNTVAVVSDGTAVLGLGRSGPPRGRGVVGVGEPLADDASCAATGSVWGG